MKVADILKQVPEGTKFWSNICGEVELAFAIGSIIGTINSRWNCLVLVI